MIPAPNPTAQRAPRARPRQRERAPAPIGAPTYIHACAEDRWRLALWPRAGGRGAVVPFRCCSRRHDGACSDHWRHTFFARLDAGQLSDAKRADVLFATWTLAPEFHAYPPDAPDAREWWSEDHWAEYTRRMREGTRLLSRALGQHLARLSKQLDRAGEGRLRYAWVIEWHKSGVAHAHAIILSPILGADTRRERRERGAGDADTTPCTRWLAAMPEGHPFGEQCGLTNARSEGAIMSYVAKLATRLGGELSKGQGTASAGQHQRTYGASRGFLAPRFPPNPDWTGTLVRRDGSPVRWDRITWQAEGLVLRVGNGDLRSVAFSPGDYSSALGMLDPTDEPLPAWARAEAVNTPPPRPARSLAPPARARGPSLPRLSSSWASPSAGARAP